MNIRKKIENLVNSKEHWDKNPILVDLLCEYITSLSKLSTVEEDYIINKLSNQLDTLRIGDFKEEDSNISYDGIPVTSEEFKDKYRKGSNTFGAITLDTNNKSAICIFDNSYGLSGININNINDMKHTLYHELTHVIEKSAINENIVNDNIVIGNIDPNKERISEYDTNTPILTSGISTIEYPENGKRIVHNQISEGCTEMITRMILKDNGITPPNDRYTENIMMAKILFDQYGKDALKTYIEDSSKITIHFLNQQIKNTNMLFFLDNYINFLSSMKKNIASVTGVEYANKNKNKLLPKVMECYCNYVKYQCGEISIDELLSSDRDEINKAMQTYMEELEIQDTMKK